MVQNSSSNVLRSGTLAKGTGVSPDTIRHYEKIGVLPRAARTDSGYRVYPASALERVLVVQRAIKLAISPQKFDEVKSLSPNHRFVIALHSPEGVDETGLLECPAEKTIWEWTQVASLARN